MTDKNINKNSELTEPTGEGQVDLLVRQHPYNSETQNKNIAWFLPRPKPDRYKGGMPLYCEKWLVELAEEILGEKELYLMNLFCGMNTQGIRIDIKKEVTPIIV